MRKLLTLTITSLLVGPLFAQGHLYLGQQFNYQNWDEDRFVSGLEEETLQLGLNIGYQLSSDKAIELSAQTNLISSGETDPKAYELSYYSLFSEFNNGFRPYFVYTLGFSDFGSDNSPLIVEDELFTLGLGIGVSKFLSEELEFRADYRVRSTVIDNLDDNAIDDGVTFALNYHFGSFRSAPAPAAPVLIPRPAPRPQPVVAPEPEPELVEVTVELDVLFATNSADIENADVAEFRRMATALRENSSANLVIEGHTDSAGSAEYNESLSQRRADAARQELIDAYNAPANQIRSVGYGEARPIADNATAAGRAQNRRVIGVLTYQTQR